MPIIIVQLIDDSTEEGDDNEVNRLMTSRQTVIEVKAPRSATGAIIGRQGSKIKEVGNNSLLGVREHLYHLFDMFS